MILGIFVGMAIMTFLFNFEDLKRAFKKRKDDKRYKRLSSGIPSRVVGVENSDDVWYNRKNPFYIDGEIFTMSFGWVHCNDDVFVIKDSNGVKFRLSSTLYSSYKYEGKWKHIRRLQLTPNQYKSSIPSRYVKVDAILEVY